MLTNSFAFFSLLGWTSLLRCKIALHPMLLGYLSCSDASCKICSVRVLCLRCPWKRSLRKREVERSAFPISCESSICCDLSRSTRFLLAYSNLFVFGSMKLTFESNAPWDENMMLFFILIVSWLLTEFLFVPSV